MVDNSSVNRPQSRPPIDPAKVPATKPARAPDDKTEPRDGPAFKALLEKLQQQAESLHRESETVARPEELSVAVDRARSSLNDALSLSDQLLEAFREAVQNDDTEKPAADPE